MMDTMYDRSYYPLHEMEVGVSCLMSEDTSISASVSVSGSETPASMNVTWAHLPWSARSISRALQRNLEKGNVECCSCRALALSYLYCFSIFSPGAHSNARCSVVRTHTRRMISQCRHEAWRLIKTRTNSQPSSFAAEDRTALSSE